jgi:glycosyltransferase involved in cell wall biosynthesis
MTVGIIARGLTKGGVARYIENILDVINRDLHHKYSFVVFTDKSEFVERYKNLRIVYVKKGNKLFWDYIKVLPYIFKYKLDVMIYPKNIIPFSHTIFSFKKINVIHDLAYFVKELNEYKFFDTLYMKSFMRLSCLIADKIVAVSRSTKKDIVDRLHIESKKIVIIHEGIEESFRRQTNTEKIQIVLTKYNIQRPFMFYCGSLSPRKNMLRTLKAFYKMKDQIPHNIYLAGGQSWHDKEVKEYIKSYLSKRVFRVGYVEEEDLPVLYSAADIYLFPSIYEGFGLPILEAQASGCVVLTSNKTSCPEVAGEGAVIVNPYDTEEMMNGVLEIATNTAYRNEIILKGFLNVKKYSWTKTADGLIECAKDLIRYEKF